MFQIQENWAFIKRLPRQKSERRTAGADTGAKEIYSQGHPWEYQKFEQAELMALMMVEEEDF